MGDTDADQPLGWFDPRGAATMQAAWEDSPALITVVVGPEHRMVYQNAVARELFGTRPLHMPLVETFPEGTGDGTVLDQVRTTGRVVEVGREVVPFRDASGAPLVLSYTIAPLDASIPAEAIVIRGRDVTAQVRAEATAQRAALLADVAAALAGAVDPTAALQAFVDTLVPALADFAAFYVTDDDNDLASEPVPPLVTASAREIESAGPPPAPAPRDEPSPWDEMLRTGVPVIIPINHETFETVAPEEAAAAWLASTLGHSIAVLPMVVAGRLTGALLLMAAGARAPFTSEDLPFLTDVAARAGAALGQQFTQQRQRNIAAQLQRALLPPEPPEVADLELAARYVAGAPGVNVGGDWWHVQDLGDGRIALGIGDVSGRGVAAAALMGQARAAMGAAGYANLPPTDVLGFLDAQLAALVAPDVIAIEPTPPKFATACYGVVDLAAGVVQLANAGHTPLLCRTADGDVRVIEVPAGAPLGLRVGGYEEAQIAFAPGDTIALFTDGLVESRKLDLDEGLGALAEALARFGGDTDLAAVLTQVLDAMAGQPGYGDDDMALLLARRR